MASTDSSRVEPTVAFRVLGPLEVCVDDRAVRLGGTPRRAVMAALLTARGASVSEDTLIEALWGDEATAAARNTLQSHVSRLRSALGRAGIRAPEQLLQRTAGGYRLRLASGQVDTDHVDVAVATARARRADDPAGAAQLLSRALSLWRGRPFDEFADLPGWTSSGMAAAQAGLDELRSTVRDDLLAARLAAGAHVEVLPQLEQAATQDPLRERIHRLLALALYRDDRHSEALAVLRRFRTRLVDEAGLEPSPEVADLEQAILLQDPGLQIPTPAAVTARPPRPPVRRRGDGALFGRTRELAHVLGALRHPGLITITGPGGVGKSRLAMEASLRVQDDPASGGSPPVVVVDVGALHRSDALAPAVAQALGVRAGGDIPVDDVLVEYLTGQRLLLVLDNCEHLRTVVADLVDRVLATGSQVTVLATSRERLGLPDEQALPLGPLPVTLADEGPDAGDVVDDDGHPLPAAVALFIAHARRSRPQSNLTDDNRPLVEELCRRLDGLPLAIELAASQLGSLGLADILDRLHDRLDLLAVPRRTSLRDVVDRSYQLLDEHEREMFERLSIFDGGFALDAVRPVAASASEALPATRTLARLVDASMVAVTDDGHGRMRYHLLETLRIHAGEHLMARGARDDTVLRHGAWITELAETARSELEGPSEARWIRRIEAEFANIRTAWHAAADRGDRTTAARITVALASYAQWHGHAELWAWSRQLVDHPDLDGHPLAVAVHGAAAQASYLQGDLAEAERLARAGMALAATTDSEHAWWCVAAAHITALFRGAYDESEALAERALAAATDSPLWRVLLAGDVVLARLYRGDTAGAHEAVARCAELAAAVGCATGRAWAQYVEGEVALGDDPDHAVAVLEDAVATARTVNATFVEGVALVSLLSAATRARDHRRAIAAVPDVVGHWQRLGGMWVQQWTTLRVVAELLTSLRIDDAAAVLFAAADAAADDAPAVTGTDAVREQQLQAGLRDRLGDQRHAQCVAAGQRLTRTGAVAYAISTALPRAVSATAAGTLPSG